MGPGVVWCCSLYRSALELEFGGTTSFRPRTNHFLQVLDKSRKRSTRRLLVNLKSRDFLLHSLRAYITVLYHNGYNTALLSQNGI